MDVSYVVNYLLKHLCCQVAMARGSIFCLKEETQQGIIPSFCLSGFVALDSVYFPNTGDFFWSKVTWLFSSILKKEKST